MKIPSSSLDYVQGSPKPDRSKTPDGLQVLLKEQLGTDIPKLLAIGKGST